MESEQENGELAENCSCPDLRKRMKKVIALFAHSAEPDTSSIGTCRNGIFKCPSPTLASNNLKRQVSVRQARNCGACAVEYVVTVRDVVS